MMRAQMDMPSDSYPQNPLSKPYNVRGKARNALANLAQVAQAAGGWLLGGPAAACRGHAEAAAPWAPCSACRCLLASLLSRLLSSTSHPFIFHPTQATRRCTRASST